MTTQLDSFESALLAELRTVVEERRPRRRRFLYAGLVAAAAAVVAVLVLPGVGTQPAYAVTEGNDGDVHVRVDRLDDAAGLERALEEHGVRADVTYLPDDMVCADGRYRDAPPQPSGSGITFSIGSGGYRVDLDAGTIRDGETVVISAARLTDDDPTTSGGVTGSVGIATGPVGPCNPVPAPPLPRES